MAEFESEHAVALRGARLADPLQLLVDATASMPPAQAPGPVLERILLAARQLIHADSSAVWRSYDGGNHWKVLAFEGLPESYRWEAFEATSSIALLNDLVISSDARNDPRLAFRHKDYIDKGIYSVMVAPLFIEGESGGTISFYYRQRHEFSESDLQYGRALANLAAVALHNFELQESQRQERQRLTFLAESSALLSSSLEYETVLQRVAELAATYIADWCTVHVLEGDELRGVAFAHSDPRKLARVRASAERAAFQEMYPEKTAQLLHAGRAIFAPVLDERGLREIASSPEHAQLMREMGIRSAIVAPLCARGKTFGVVRFFLAESEHRFSMDDLSLAEDLARRASVAADNARLYRELEVSEARYRSLIDVTTAIVWTSDPRGALIEPQRSWSAFTGQTWEQARGWGWSNAVHPEDRGRMQMEWDATVNSGKGHYESAGRIWHQPSHSYHHCTARAVAMHDASGKVYEWVGLLMDIHDQKLSEDKLRRTEKLATAGRLAATVAHEINNPLEAVTNLIYLAERCEQLPPDALGYLEQATIELQRVAHIVRQTLGFYREASFPRPTDIGLLVNEVLALYQRPFTKHGLTVSTSIALQVIAEVVAGEIRQVIANLISNAIDASQANDVIAVAVRETPKYVEIEVADRGDGIPDANRVHIFEPFFTTKKDIGTGLGLWVSKGIVDKHGGTLSYETHSGNNHGTVFTVRLPGLRLPPEIM